MECFYHEGRPAVGSCRSCLKGICRGCLVDLGKGLACVGRCEQAVRDLLATLELSVRYRGVSGGMLNAAGNLWLGLAVIALLVGVFVTAWGLTLPVFREVSLLGVAFLTLGLLTLRVARKVRSSEGSPSRPAQRPAADSPPLAPAPAAARARGPVPEDGQPSLAGRPPRQPLTTCTESSTIPRR